MPALAGSTSRVVESDCLKQQSRRPLRLIYLQSLVDIQINHKIAEEETNNLKFHITLMINAKVEQGFYSLERTIYIYITLTLYIWRYQQAPFYVL